MLLSRSGKLLCAKQLPYYTAVHWSLSTEKYKLQLDNSTKENQRKDCVKLISRGFDPKYLVGRWPQGV